MSPHPNPSPAHGRETGAQHQGEGPGVTLSASSDLGPSGVREEAKPSLRPVWLVFARRRYGEPLAEVGTIRADTPEMAAMFARSIYDEHPWIEMVVAPRSSMRTVIVP